MFTLANLYLLWQRHILHKSTAMTSLSGIEAVVKHILRSDSGSIVCKRVQAVNSLPLQNECEVLYKGEESQLTRNADITVNLHDWTSYLESPRATSGGTMHIILESSPPIDEEQFIADILEIPPESRVELLSVCQPVAWKAGNPFSIVCSCTADQFILLCRSYLENRLIMDELLRIDMLASVKVSGHSFELLTSDSKALLQRASSSQAHILITPELEETNVDDDVWEDDINEQSLVTESLVKTEHTTDNVFECKGDNGPIKRDSSMQALTKSPNILIYTGKKFASATFESLKEDLVAILGQNAYTIYHLKHNDVCTSPWQQNCRLVIIATEQLHDGLDSVFSSFLYSGGRLLSFCSNFDKDFIERQQNDHCNHLKVVSVNYKERQTHASIQCQAFRGRFYYTSYASTMPGITLLPLAYDDDHKCVITEASFSQGGMGVFTQVHIEQRPEQLCVNSDMLNQLKSAGEQHREDVVRQLLKRLDITTVPIKETRTSVTQARIFTSDMNQRTAFMKNLRLRHNSKIKDDMLCLPNVGDIDLNENKCSEFDFTEYWKNLSSRIIGNTVIYQQITKTTQAILEPFMFCVPVQCGLVATCSQQISGVGRGGNSWLSPSGSLSLSMHIKLDLTSNLGRAPALIQTVPAVAVAVMMDKHLKGNDGEDSLVKVKWPNDVYYKDIKIGGVIVKSTMLQSTLHAIVGIGMNVCNPQPTLNLNDVIDERNSTHSNKPMISHISLEYVMARVCSETESLIDLLNEDKTEYMNVYYKYWMHSGVRVDVPHEQLSNALILGLDENGYLLLERDDGSTFSAQPDGNSFDIMHNLITLKES